jgi:hypothetical protein
MRIILICIAAAVLAACSNVPRDNIADSPCVNNETSYACQVERYGKVQGD